MNSPRHLLVDGANVLHAWPGLRALLARDREAARACLVRRTTVIHDGEGVRATVVFDGRGEQLTLEHPKAVKTLTVIHTPRGQTADDVIEQMVAASRHPGQCAVATSDRGVRETVQASGAEVISPEELAAWWQRSERAVARRLEAWRTRQPA